MAVGVSNQPYPGVMKTRINPPHPQPGPIAFAVVCAFGGLVAVRGMLQLRIGTEPWWVSLLAIAMLIPALVFIGGAGCGSSGNSPSPTAGSSCAAGSRCFATGLVM